MLWCSSGDGDKLRYDECAAFLETSRDEVARLTCLRRLQTKKKEEITYEGFDRRPSKKGYLRTARKKRGGAAAVAGVCCCCCYTTGALDLSLHGMPIAGQSLLFLAEEDILPYVSGCTTYCVSRLLSRP